MAHYAKIGSGNIVTRVHVLDNEVLLKDGKEDETTGVEFLQNIHGNKDLYIQTSYNGTFRKNYAGIGYKYDDVRDAFIEPKPFDSWALDDDTCKWNTPTPYPDDGKKYYWIEDTTSWKEIE